MTCSFISYGQYWFGPKIGASYIDHVYQEKAYEKDSFDIDPDINFQAGVAISYSATERYAVYGELTYEKVEKTIKDKQTGGQLVKTNMTNHFLSAPIMLRIILGNGPLHFFANGGPRLSYWLGGKGSMDLDEFDEFAPAGRDDEGRGLPVDYKLTFNSEKALEGNNEKALISEPNRVQFGLTLGGGMFFDLASGNRLQVDFRYTWVHSNMGENSGIQDINFDRESYRENFEYYHNIATVGVAYLFGYNTDSKRKGASNNKKSNKKKK